MLNGLSQTRELLSVHIDPFCGAGALAVPILGEQYSDDISPYTEQVDRLRRAPCVRNRARPLIASPKAGLAPFASAVVGPHGLDLPWLDRSPSSVQVPGGE